MLDHQIRRYVDSEAANQMKCVEACNEYVTRDTKMGLRTYADSVAQNKPSHSDLRVSLSAFL